MAETLEVVSTGVVADGLLGFDVVPSLLQPKNNMQNGNSKSNFFMVEFSW